MLQGSLAHRDSMGNSGVIYPGLAQRMSAGSGVLHSEKNGSASERVHFVQMWVVPDESGIAPGYQQAEIDDGQLTGGLVTIASGMHDDAAITIHNRNAALHGARLQPGRCRPAARSAVPASVRPSRRGDTRRSRVSSRRRRRPVHRVGRPAHHRYRAVRDPRLGDACGFGCRVTGSPPGSSASPCWPGVRQSAPPQPSPGRRVADVAGSACAGVGEVGVGARRRSRRSGAGPFDEPRQALVPEGWTMSVWARIPEARLAAWTPDGALLRVGTRKRADREADTETRCGAARVGAPRRAGPTARDGVRGFDPLCRRERPGRRLRLRQRGGHQPADRRRRASRRAQPGTARRLRARAQERRRGTRRCGLLLDRFDGQHLRARTATPIPRARPSCGSRPAAARPSRSRRASAMEPASPSRRTGRCGRRSTTATMRPTRTATSTPSTSTSTRRSPWRGSPPAANSVGRTAIPTAAPPICRSSATCPPTPTGRGWTAPACRRSSRASARTRRRSGCRSRRCAAAAVCERSVGRRARLVEPAAAACARGVVLPLAGRHSRRPADTRRRLPGRRRVAVGPTGRGGGRARRRGLHHRRLRGRRLPIGPPGR